MRSQRHLHILFIDHDESLMGPCTEMLEKLGHSVNGQNHSLNALRVFSDEPDAFDLAIIDHDMPELTGLELGERFRRIRPGFPVMLYSGRLDGATEARIAAAGIGHVVLEPVSVDRLEGAVRAALL